MIDVHLHVVPPNLPGVGSLSPLLRYTPKSVAEALLTQIQTSGTTAMLAMGAWNITPEDPLGIACTLKVAALVPGLFAVGVMDPTKDVNDNTFFGRVEAELMAKRAVALKGYLGYLPYGPDHPTYRRYYELAAKYRVPVFLHTGDTYSPQAKLKFAQPLLVDDVAVDHPETKFILAHVGNPWTIDCAAVVYKNMNVWADLSGLVVGDGSAFYEVEMQEELNDVAERFRQAFRYAERPNRFLFGTDWPLIPMLPYRDFIRDLVPPEHHQAVFYDNAMSLLKLPGMNS